VAIESADLEFQYFNLPARYFTLLDMPTIQADLKLVARILSEHVIVAVSEFKGGLTIQIVADKDEPGIFMRVAAILYSHRICILKATIFTGKKDTMVIDHFVVHPQTERALLDLACNEIRDALLHKTTCAPELCKPDNTDLSITCVQTKSDDAIVAITVREQAGFLYRVSKILSDLELNLTDADINTKGDRIFDTFHIVTSDRKMPSLDKLSELNDALLIAFRG
jgi:UTP:GlnB (protein PII) uridylyltransferase